MGNVIYAGSTKILNNNQNNSFSNTVLFDSGTIVFDANDNYTWKINKEIITNSNYDNVQPIFFEGYKKPKTETGWYKDYYNGFKIPLTLEVLKSYSEITITTIYTPRSQNSYLFLSNQQGLEQPSEFCVEVAMNTSYSDKQHYSVQTLRNLGPDLYLSKNEISDDPSTLDKCQVIDNIYEEKVGYIDNSSNKSWLYNLSQTSDNTDLYIKAYQSSTNYNLTNPNLYSYPIGAYYRELRIIISGR